MKLGAAGILGDGSPELVRRAVQMGFRQVSWHLRDLALASDFRMLDRVKAALDGEGVGLCQLLPPTYPSLVDLDPSVRAEGVDALRRVIDAAVRMGAGNVYVRPGSLNPRGAWTPHPHNHRPETRARLVESLRGLVPHAAAVGILLAIEGHAVSPLDTPEVAREVLDAVDSPLLGVNADLVNFITNLDEAYDASGLIARFFDRLGPRVVCGHAKDVTVGDRLVVHIDECVPGEGYLDHAAVLRRFDACCPGGVLLIEHLPPEKVPAARAALLRVAAEAGIPIEEA